LERRGQIRMTKRWHLTLRAPEEKALALFLFPLKASSTLTDALTNWLNA
jgi:hypothetical protein